MTRPSSSLLLSRSCSPALALAPAHGGGGDAARALTPSGWSIRPAGARISVARSTHGLPGPARLRAVALRPEASVGVERRDAHQLGRPLRPAARPADRHRRLRLPPRHGRGGLLRRHVLARRQARVGLRRRPERRPRLRGRQGPARDRHDPDAALPRRDRPTARRRAATASTSPTTSPAVAGSSNPPGRSVTVIDPNTNQVTGTIDLGLALQPYGVTFSRRGSKAYVTNWMGRSVSVIDTRTETVRRRILLSPPSNPLLADHPNAIATNPRRNEVYTANGNSDTVSFIDTRRDRVIKTLKVGLVGGARPGRDPQRPHRQPGRAAALRGARRRERDRGHRPRPPPEGRLHPDGLEPDRRRHHPRRVEARDHDRERGRPAPARAAPGPTRSATAPPATSPTPPPRSASARRAASTSCAPRARKTASAASRASSCATTACAPAARRSRAWLGAIRHVIYVVKENRTYDQVLGDIGKGDGDPGLVLFDEDSAPNHRELARRFTLFDNFYADADVSADGQSWTVAAGVTDYIDKMWPITYSPGSRRRHRARDFEHVDFADQFFTLPLAFDRTIFRGASALTRGYLWDNAYHQAVSFRNYGMYTRLPGDCTGAGNTSDVTHLDDRRFGDNDDERFPGFNMRCSDHAQRLPTWQRDFDAYEAAYRADPSKDPLPALSILRLPNDHTWGTTPGKAIPESYMADNDLALGRLVERVSEEPVLAQHRDHGHRGRRAERARPRRRPPHAGVRDQPLHADRAGRPHALRHRRDGRHARGPARPAADDDRRPARDADVEGLRAQAELPPLRRDDAGGRSRSAPRARRSTPATRRWPPPRRAGTSTSRTRRPRSGSTRRSGSRCTGRNSRMPDPRHEHIIGSQPADADAGG